MLKINTMKNNIITKSLILTVGFNFNSEVEAINTIKSQNTHINFISSYDDINEIWGVNAMDNSVKERYEELEVLINGTTTTLTLYYYYIDSGSNDYLVIFNPSDN
jgi:hypothetical protein